MAYRKIFPVCIFILILSLAKPFQSYAVSVYDLATIFTFPSSGCMFSSATTGSLMRVPLTQFWTPDHAIFHVVSFCLPCDRDSKFVFHHHESHPLCQSFHELQQTIHSALTATSQYLSHRHSCIAASLC